MATELIKKFIAALVKPRKANTDKTDFGHALLIAGNTGKMGAAILAAKACVRCGAGLTTVCVPQKEAAIIQIAVPEAMVISRENLRILKNFHHLELGQVWVLIKMKKKRFAVFFRVKQQLR